MPTCRLPARLPAGGCLAVGRRWHGSRLADAARLTLAAMPPPTPPWLPALLTLCPLFLFLASTAPPAAAHAPQLASAAPPRRPRPLVPCGGWHRLHRRHRCARMQPTWPPTPAAGPRRCHLLGEPFFRLPLVEWPGPAPTHRPRCPFRCPPRCPAAAEPYLESEYGAEYGREAPIKLLDKLLHAWKDEPDQEVGGRPGRWVPAFTALRRPRGQPLHPMLGLMTGPAPPFHALLFPAQPPRNLTTTPACLPAWPPNPALPRWW